ncbi:MULTISPECIES: hypothetical protein [unclassified Halorubrum]|uniref:hypothetical protein n=1 Tax=unclassified Halorubrum TaxID=2642239 RepID=UPI0011C42A8D|nr:MULTISPECIES: hypothetical protein [unclassified Halorubrum]
MNTTTNRNGGMSRRAFLGAGAVVAATSLAGCTARGLGTGETTDRREWTFAPGAVTELRVASDVGSVTVAGRSTDAVEVGATKRSWNGQRGLDALAVDADLVDGVLTVVSTADTGRIRTDQTPRVDLTIGVPAGAEGPAVTRVTTDFGEVTLTDTRGDARIQTVAGAIVASGVDGYLSLRSTAGHIEAASVTGLDDVRTEIGRVKVEVLGVRRDTAIRSEVGDVVVGVAADLDLDVLAEADGRVSSDLELSDQRSRRNRVAGRLNDGGHRLHAASDFGRVDLRRMDR